MSGDIENACELPQIVYQKTSVTIDKHDYINIEVRGKNLTECRKHFDEILKEGF